jgi:hypothetical protein
MLTPPLLRPAPRLCTNGVSAGVMQGQGRRPFYALPLCSPCPLLRPPFVREQDSCRCRGITPHPCTAPAVCSGAEGM